MSSRHHNLEPWGGGTRQYGLAGLHKETAVLRLEAIPNSNGICYIGSQCVKLVCSIALNVGEGMFISSQSFYITFKHIHEHSIPSARYCAFGKADGSCLKSKSHKYLKLLRYFLKINFHSSELYLERWYSCLIMASLFYNI